MLIIDRIEGDVAVCEYTDGACRERRDIPLNNLPAGVREGDCLRVKNGSYVADPEETARRRAVNRELFQRLLKSGE